MIYILTAIHNRIDDTREFLDCIKMQSFRDFKLILVDDGSTDGSYEFISTNYPEVILLRGDGNLWWTGAINLALRHVISLFKEGDFVLIINSDVVFGPDYLEQILKAGIDHDRSIVGSLCKSYNNHEEIIDSGVKIDWEEYRYSLSPLLPIQDFTQDIDTLSTRGVLIPIEAIQKIGFMDSRHFPHYGSDYDYMFTAKKRGFDLIVAYKAVVYNKPNLTEFRPLQRSTLSYKELWKKYFNIKSPSNLTNNFFLILKHCPSVILKIKLILRSPYIIIKNNFMHTL